MDSQHDKFLARLADSEVAVSAIASWLHRQGKRIERGPMLFAPTAAEYEKYVDDGDLFVLERKRVEVKRISKDFTNASDWPYPDMLISNVASVDRARDVVAYITVSNNLKHCAVVDTKTRDQWRVVERRAKNTGNIERFYSCPVGCAQFRSME